MKVRRERVIAAAQSTYRILVLHVTTHRRKDTTPRTYKVTAELAYPYIGITNAHLDYMDGVFDGFRPTITEGPDGRALVHLLIPSNTETWATTLGAKLIATSIAPRLGPP